MTRYKCFVIDDEPLAIDVLVNYLNRLDEFEVVETFTDPVQAYQALKKEPIDLVFLDIKMPEFNGLDFIKSLSNRPEVILTTAFREFAVDGFELDVLDYLVKPIAFDRFMKAVNKFAERNSETGEKNKYLVVRANRKFIKLKLVDIYYIEGLKDYVRIVLKDREVLTKQSIGAFFEDLPDGHFIRVHKSFAAAFSKITAYSHRHIELGTFEVPIGRVYKKQVLNRLG